MHFSLIHIEIQKKLFLEIKSNFYFFLLQLRDSAESQVTVTVPLYVSYIYVTAPRGWGSLEHHTDMEFTFRYDTVLWRTGTFRVEISFSSVLAENIYNYVELISSIYRDQELLVLV